MSKSAPPPPAMMCVSYQSAVMQKASSKYRDNATWARILVRVTIYRRLRIGRDGHLDQSEAYDIS